MGELQKKKKQKNVALLFFRRYLCVVLDTFGSRPLFFSFVLLFFCLSFFFSL